MKQVKQNLQSTVLIIDLQLVGTFKNNIDRELSQEMKDMVKVLGIIKHNLGKAIERLNMGEKIHEDNMKVSNPSDN